MYYTHTRKHSRRLYRLKRQTCLIMITFIVIIFGVLFGSSLLNSSHPKAAPEYTEKLYYTSVKVEEGDSLWSIAEENMSAQFDSIPAYIKEIKEINHITDDTIQSGAYITIPYYK